MLDSIEGLSVGDAFGEQFFDSRKSVGNLMRREEPPPPWLWTDDTTMALSLVEQLARRGRIDAPALADSFIAHYDITRGYGPAISRLLRTTTAGSALLAHTREMFDGQGSYGNGAAMRVAPLGAFFADDLAQCVEQARRSAEVTHTHPEGVAGAIAVAVAAAIAWQHRAAPPDVNMFITLILPHVPPSEVAARLRRAAQLAPKTSLYHIAMMLGNGSTIAAQDTVPFAIWCAGQHLGSYAEALWHTASGLGDIDTNCAIVGGIVASAVGRQQIPSHWLAAREPLPAWPFDQ